MGAMSFKVKCWRALVVPDFPSNDFGAQEPGSDKELVAGGPEFLKETGGRS